MVGHKRFIEICTIHILALETLSCNLSCCLPHGADFCQITLKNLVNFPSIFWRYIHNTYYNEVMNWRLRWLANLWRSISVREFSDPWELHWENNIMMKRKLRHKVKWKVSLIKVAIPKAIFSGKEGWQRLRDAPFRPKLWWAIPTADEVLHLICFHQWLLHARALIGPLHINLFTEISTLHLKPCKIFHVFNMRGQVYPMVTVTELVFFVISTLTPSYGEIIHQESKKTASWPIWQSLKSLLLFTSVIRMKMFHIKAKKKNPLQ